MDEKFDHKFDQFETKINQLDQKVDDLTISITEAIEISNEEIDKQLKNHKVRISRLENQAA